MEGAGSTSTGIREEGEGEEEEEERRLNKPLLGDEGGGDGEADDDDGGDDGVSGSDDELKEEEVDASSPSLSLVTLLSSVADKKESSSRDRSAAREVSGPQGRNGVPPRATAFEERHVGFVGSGVDDAGMKRWCFFAVLLHSSSPPAACLRACDIVSRRAERKKERTGDGQREKGREGTGETSLLVVWLVSSLGCSRHSRFFFAENQNQTLSPLPSLSYHLSLFSLFLSPIISLSTLQRSP